MQIYGAEDQEDMDVIMEAMDRFEQTGSAVTERPESKGR